MSFKNILLVICLLTSLVFQVNAVNSSNGSISTTKNISPKPTLKERLLVNWVEKKLRKADNKFLPPDLKKCLNINLKNRRVHKGYEVRFSDSSVAFKKCDKSDNTLTEVQLSEIESVTSTDGKQIYFENEVEKVQATVSEEPKKIHPAILTGLGLTGGGIAAALFVNIFFGLIMVMAGVLLAVVTKKMLGKANSEFKGAGLVNIITGIGMGVFLLIASVIRKFKR